LYQNPWIYNDKVFDSEGIQDAVGFIYEITNTVNGKKYIGKKILMAAKRKQVKGKVKKFRGESDWQKYYGSSQDVKDDVLTLGKEKFIRRILKLCYSKSEMSYWEMREIFARDALIRDDYYNSWVSCRINRRNLKGIFVNDNSSQDLGSDDSAN